MASKSDLSQVKKGQDREQHKEPHSFYVCEYDKTQYKISCKTAGSVLEVLNGTKFSSLVSKNKGKDLVIVRQKPHKADVATHFPCWLIKETEELTIEFSRKNNPDPDPGPPPTATITKEQEVVTFYVSRIGRENCKSKDFLKNMNNKHIPYICIYACVGETVEEALQRDGRFAEMVFEKGSELFEFTGSFRMEMSNVVEKSVDSEIFQLNMKRQKKPKPDSISEMTGQRIAPAEEQDESPPGSDKSAPAKPPLHEQGESTPGTVKSAHAEPSSAYQPIPNTKELLEILRSQCNDLVKHMKEREKVKGEEKVLELLREEFGKNTKAFLGVEHVRNMVEMSKYVCYVCVNGGLQGTGFLLFDRFVLTNAHVIKLRNGDISRAVDILVNFHYEIWGKAEPNLSVEEVIAWADRRDEEKMLDYAVLKLNVTGNLPPPLLTKYCPPVQRGGMCIIGHPEGGVKALDFCSIMEHEKYQNTLLSLKLYPSCLPKVITYDTCFFHGSSGSPVFHESGHVAAMHTGGFTYRLCNTNNVFEYAITLQSILEDFLCQVLHKLENDILIKFIEAAKTQDYLHYFIAYIIKLLNLSVDERGLLVLDLVITTVESDKDLRERCWSNTLEIMPHDLRQTLKDVLSQKLDEKKKTECYLYQLLLAFQR